MNNTIPRSMQRWIEKQRSRALRLSTDEKQIVENQIQEIVHEATVTNKIWLNDWTKQELPVLDGDKPHLLHCDIRFITLDIMLLDKQKRLSLSVSANPNTISKPIDPSTVKIHPSYSKQKSLSSLIPPPSAVPSQNYPTLSNPAKFFTLSEPGPKDFNQRLYNDSLRGSLMASKAHIFNDKQQPSFNHVSDHHSGYVSQTSSSDSPATRPDNQVRQSPIPIKDKYTSTTAVEQANDNSSSRISLPYNEYRYPYPPITGTSRELEKFWQQYSSSEAPSARVIRDLETLETWFFKLEEMYISNDDSTVSYSYIQDQMRSIEQDLYYQDIHNAFTLIVYEAHIHLNIKYKNFDDGEFEVLCIKLLDYFYKLPENIKKNDENKFEIINYYVIYLSYKREFNRMREFMVSIRPLLSSNHKSMIFIFKFFKAFYTHNYYELFRLYQLSSNFYLDQTIIDLFIDRERMQCLGDLKNGQHLEKVNFEYLLIAFRFKDEVSAIQFFKKYDLEKCISIGPTLIEFNL